MRQCQGADRQYPTKVISLMLAVLAGFAGVDYLVQRQVIFPSFVELEREQAAENLERAIEAIAKELEFLTSSVVDWARWDETYRFMLDRNPQYIDDNLSLDAIRNLRIDLIAFHSLEGDRIQGVAINAGAKSLFIKFRLDYTVFEASDGWRRV